jgi:acetylornithine deacetylase/succinyl-diaminopimelate desuccinylase-like protein
MAKISMRLVPKQDPSKIHRSLLNYLRENAPNTVQWEVVPFAGNPACISDLNFPAVKAMHSALSQVWGVEPAYKREGGSIPVVLDMQKILGVESVITGFGLPDDNLHSPNEKIHLPTWRRGIDAFIHFFYNLPERLQQ